MSAFVDDTTLLAYGSSTEANCRTLTRAHDRCLDWARRYGASFAPEKYELIHLARRPKRFNMRAQLQLGDIAKEPSTSVRILGIWLESPHTDPWDRFAQEQGEESDVSSGIDADRRLGQRAAGSIRQRVSLVAEHLVEHAEI